MNAQDWFVDEFGRCQLRPTTRAWDLLRERYYLHQFLSETLDVLAHAPHELDEWDYLPQIRRKVRQLITNSYWITTQYAAPNTPSGVHVTTLYDETGYPLTVQNVTTQPGIFSSIHNHGTWGVVFQIQGEDHHTFWQRIYNSAERFEIQQVDEHLLKPGEIISFHPDAIHQVQTVGDNISLTFQLYGDTQPQGRLQFDPEAQTARHF